MFNGKKKITAGLLVFGLFLGGIIYSQSLNAETVKQPQNNPISSSQAKLSPQSVRERNKPAIQNLIAQTKLDIEFALDGNNDTFTFISGQGKPLPIKAKPAANEASAVAQEFMREYGAYFGLRDAQQELTLIKKDIDSLGLHHVRYNQAYLGIPVFGAQAIVHLNNNLSVASSNSRLIPNITINSTPSLTQSQAISQAKKIWQEQFHISTADDVRASLFILNKGIIENKPDSASYLVWRVTLNNKEPAQREFYFIDAQNGTLAYQITGIQKAISRRIYDCSRYLTLTCALGTLYSGYTYGRSEGQPVRGTNPTVYGGTDVDDLYSITGSTHNYYSGTFARNGANNLGGLGDGSVDFPSNKTDVFSYYDDYDINFNYPLVCPNAFFDGATLNFCQGLEVTDVTAHEYAHGVTAYTADLTYANQSGALNESYSDIFGEAVEFYAEGSSDWLVGEDINIPGLIGPLRSMSDPASLGDPDRFYSPNYYCGASDGGGVHTNSSVPNHAAYLMAMGGTFNGCTITGIGRAKEEAIWYRALTVYLTASSNFNSAFTALIASCNDLYGAGSSDCQQTTMALQAVEMDQAGRCSAVAAAAPGCGVPIVTNITSEKTNSYYKAGDVIDIDLTFSSAATGSGTVTLDTGGSCIFSVSNATTATCDYTVVAGENSADLTVASISGAITNQFGDAMTSFTPVVNLAANKAIIVDTTAPTGTINIDDNAGYTTDVAVLLNLFADDTNGVPSMRFSNDGATYSDWEAGAWTKLWSLDANQGTKAVYVQYLDNAGNIGTASDSIIYDSILPITSHAPVAGRILKNNSVTLTVNETATIYYSADGSTPTTNSSVYSSPISITSDTTIKYFAVDPAGNTETYQTASYLTIKANYVVAISNQGGDSLIKALNYKGVPRSTPKNLYPFSKTYKGGGHIAVCDVDGDLKDEIVVGVGAGEEPWVKVIKSNGTLVTKFLAYAKTTKGGVFVACGDLAGDGKAEVVTGVPEGFGPHVRVFNGQTGQATITNGFFAYAQNVRTGIRVAAGDLDGDGKDEIIVGTGQGAGSHVRTFSGTGALKFTPGFFVYEKTDRTGIKVAAGDVNGDGLDEIITGTGKGRASEVKIYDRNGKELKKFSPYGNAFKGGVKVSTADLDADGVSEIITGTEAGSAPQVKTFEMNGTLLGAFFAYDKNTRFGVEVAGASLD